MKNRNHQFTNNMEIGDFDFYTNVRLQFVQNIN